jgi:hypothetical protein
MTDRLSPEREAEIAARTEAAYPGPWRRSEEGLERTVLSEDDIVAISFGYRGNNTQAEADFVAHAREDVPALLAELAAVRAERDEYRERALDAENRSIVNGREVCADCERPVLDGPCGVHSPDAVFQRTCQEAARLRTERDEAQARWRQLAERLDALQASHIADTRELHDLRQAVAR